jgi:hypothetical protein
MTRHIPISSNAILRNWEAWLKGVVAAAIAGSANGIITGFAAVGIDPSHFNLQSGLHATLSIAMISAAMSGIIGVAAYLKQSPLPPSEDDDRDSRDRDARDHGGDPDERVGHEDAIPEAIRHDANRAGISR